MATDNSMTSARSLLEMQTKYDYYKYANVSAAQQAAAQVYTTTTMLPTTITTVTNTGYPGQINTSAQVTQVAFCDVYGHHHLLNINPVFVPLLESISRSHQQNLGLAPMVASPPPMIEPDFSLDEISKAKQIMDEINA